MNRRMNQGFTLIELLVVVAIIALLMAILIPSLGAAKRNAQTSVCLSNLKQLGVGTAMYQQENSYIFPFPTTSIDEGTGWFTALDGYLGPLARDNVNAGDNAVGKRNFRKFKQCAIWGSISTASAKPIVNTVQNIQQWSRTIKMNTDLRRAVTVGTKTTYTQARLGDIEQPADFVAYGDGTAPDIVPWGSHPNADGDEAGTMSMDTVDGTQGGVALRHAGGANIVFVDGHASTVKLKTVKRTVTGSSVSVDSWDTEWLTSGGAKVFGENKLALPVESSQYKRNPDMPLIWSIPGKLYR